MIKAGSVPACLRLIIVLIAAMSAACGCATPTGWRTESKSPDGKWIADAVTTQDSGAGQFGFHTTVYLKSLSDPKTQAPVQAADPSSANKRQLAGWSANCYRDVATDSRTSAGRVSGRGVGATPLTRRCRARAWVSSMSANDRTGWAAKCLHPDSMSGCRCERAGPQRGRMPERRGARLTRRFRARIGISERPGAAYKTMIYLM